jgi:hypothetical protein
MLVAMMRITPKACHPEPVAAGEGSLGVSTISHSPPGAVFDFPSLFSFSEI